MFILLDCTGKMSGGRYRIRRVSTSSDLARRFSHWNVFLVERISGTVTAAGVSSGRMISVEGAFPFRSSAELVYLESTFDEPLLVVRARVNDERFSVVLVDSPVLHPGAKSLLGTLK